MALRAAAPRSAALTLAAGVSLQALGLAVLTGLLGLGWVRDALPVYSDVPLYMRYGGYLRAGMVPYVDFIPEYPPLALGVFALPAFGGGFASYHLWFGVCMTACQLTAAGLVAATAQRLWGDHRRTLVAAAVYAGGTLLGGNLVIDRFDSAVVLVVAFVLWAVCGKRAALSGAGLAIGVRLKLIPGLWVWPVALAAGGRWRRNVAALAGVVVAIFAPWAWAGGRGLLSMVAYHIDRPLQIESVPATPALLAHALHISTVESVFSYGSQNVLGVVPSLAEALTGPALAVAMTVLYVLLWRRRGRLRLSDDAAVVAVAAVLLVALSGAKVLSPQFVMWAMPAVALLTVSGRKPAALAAWAALGAVALTRLEYPWAYDRLTVLDPVGVTVVTIRNVALLAAAAMACLEVARWSCPPAGHGGPGSPDSGSGDRVAAGDAPRGQSPGRRGVGPTPSAS